jgi:hypothetical protein
MLCRPSLKRADLVAKIIRLLESTKYIRENLHKKRLMDFPQK